MRINEAGWVCNFGETKHTGRNGEEIFLAVLICVLAILGLAGCSGIASVNKSSVPVAPSITTQPASQTVTLGQVASFMVVATGTAPLGYQWSKNGTAIVGATSSSYATPATTSSDNGAQFTVVVNNAAGNMSSSAATLTVSAAPVAPSITAQPANQMVTAGQAATFAVAATGTAALSYQWSKNGTAIVGATSSSYATPATTSSDNGAQFTVVVSNTAGSVASNPAVLTVTAAPVAPSITAQPASQTVTAGQTASFSVAATGTAPLSYQWSKNGAAIAGATSASYTAPATTSADNGAQFTVVVSNSTGSATSNAATLTVNAPQLSATPTSASFVNVVTGTSNSQTITLTNGGNANTTISQANFSGMGFSTTGLTLPLTILPGGTANFNVVFAPTVAGGVTGSISLVSNASGSPLAISLSGTGVVPTFLLGANPTSLSFGNVNVGTSSSLSTTLTNNGNSNVTISSVTPTGVGFSASGVTAGAVLAPNQTATLNVAFAPVALGAVTGSVAVLSNATNSPAIITLSGTGVAPLPAVAFPGAEGGGALSVGGRGGTIYFVTNTADSGAGSLRACINASGPRTCIFLTGGTIALLSSLTITNPFITIAGQTAPGGGIQLRGPSGANAPGNPSLLVRTHDVIVQYIRIRRGHNAGEVCNQSPWSCGMSLEVLANSASDNPYNIMFDHISAEWSNYDALGMAGSINAVNNPRSITVSHSIIGEEFAGAGQTTGAAISAYSGQGSAAPDTETDIDLHHNLLAGASHRMPLMTIKSGRLVNNFVYAWTYYPMRNKGFRDIINNYFKYRSGQSFVSHEIQAWTTNDGNDTSFAPSFYVIGNVGPSDPSGTNNWAMTGLAINESAGEGSSPLSAVYQRSTPIPTPAGYTPITADPVSTISSPSGWMLNTARTAPYDGAGASRRLDCKGNWVDAQDPVDSRILNAVANGTTLFGSYTYLSLSTSPQSQADLGGWPTLAAGTACADVNNNGLPDIWESYWGGVFGLGTTLSPNSFDFGDQYTNLEHYLNGVSPSP